VSEVARRTDIVPGQIYRWRHELAGAAVGFSEVMVSPPSSRERSGADTLAVEIEIGADIRVRLPMTMP